MEEEYPPNQVTSFDQENQRIGGFTCYNTESNQFLKRRLMESLLFCSNGKIVTLIKYCRSKLREALQGNRNQGNLDSRLDPSRL